MKFYAFRLRTTAMLCFSAFVFTSVSCGSLKKNTTTEKGEAGAQGPAGQDGARGSAGAWEVYALKTGKRVGLLMGGIYQTLDPGLVMPVQLPDGSRTLLNSLDGTISMRVYATQSTILASGVSKYEEGAVCRYTTTDCTGTCYFTGDATVEIKPAKDVLFRIGQRFFKGTGSETDAGALVSNSHFEIGGNCNQTQQNWTSSYAVPEYTPPEGFEYPFGGLDIRPNTQ